MITDEIVEILNRLIDKLEGTAYAQGVDVAMEALCSYSEDDWLEMSESEKDKFIIAAIRKHIQ